MRDYGSPLDPGLPVVCLAGLSRNAADFGPLAEALSAGAAGQKRRVVAIDYRGRGLSDFDPDWQNYEVSVENADIGAMLTAAEVHAAIFVGTSRGGIHVMSLAVRRPGLILGALASWPDSAGEGWPRAGTASSVSDMAGRACWQTTRSS